MKKKLVVLMLAGMMAFSATACGSEKTNEPQKVEKKTEATAPSNEKKEEKSKVITGPVDQISFDNAEGTVVYDKHEVITDYEGNPAIRIYFNYTNKTDDPSNLYMTFYPKVFQNGVECDTALASDENESEMNTSKDVLTGTTINIAISYSLQDNTSPVTLQMSDQSAENLFEDYKQTQELALQ